MKKESQKRLFTMLNLLMLVEMPNKALYLTPNELSL